jgi:3-hydroxyacyl-CoA dehydrogenase
VASLVEYEKYGAVAVIKINNPPVNALSVGVPKGIADCLSRGVDDPTVAAIVLMGGGTTFIGGADIRELDQLSREDFTLRDALPALENCRKPVIAAIHGTALGGGLETALACHFRCAVPTAKFGLPEVKLGLLPGAGGTQRLPRLVGIPTALDMMLTGEHIDADKALRIGLLDEILTGELLPAALGFADRVIAEKRPLRRISQMNVPVDGEDSGDVTAAERHFRRVRTSLEEKAQGYLAPFLIVDCVEASVTLPFSAGLEKEAELFTQCLESPQSRALVHLFFAERAASKIPGLVSGIRPRSIAKVAVIGAGTMGGGIAMSFANAGIEVKILEVAQANLDRGLAAIRSNYERSVAKGSLAPEKMAARLGLLQGTLEYQDLADADLVIEAVFEDMELKKEILGTLDGICKPGAILATNTSTLNVDEVAAATARPRDIVGLHFFSPANVMRLLEVVRGRETAPDVLVTAIDVARKIRKLPVVVGVCYGFVGNRMLEPYMREALRLVLEGATPEQVDGVLTRFGLAMGVLSMCDLAGIDVGYHIRQSHRQDFQHDPTYHILSDRLYELGRYGQKTSRGFYLYEGRQKISDPEVPVLAEQLAAWVGVTRRSISEQEILERCLFMLINEGARILEEGIASRSSDCDLIWTNGYGFPVWRGGPMRYADEIGLEKVLEGIKRYRSALGEYGSMWFTPAPLLEKLVAEKRSFAEYRTIPPHITLERYVDRD